MDRFRLIALTVLTLLGAGCASSKPRYNPFQVKKEEIRDRVKVVAVAPVRVGDDVPNATQARQEYGELIVNELGTLGFQTVPATEYEQIFNRLRDEMGGYFDPNTGKADNEKFKKVQDLCRRELATKFHADAVLYPSIRVFSVRFVLDRAKWDGVHESVRGPGWLEKAFLGTSNGTVPAMSLCVLMVDVDGNNLYSQCGGIQLMAKLIGYKFRNVNDENILTDTQRNTNAVAIAFKAFHDEEPVARHN